MPRSWSEAIKACRKHPKKSDNCGRKCRSGWRYRLGVPDPVTGRIGRPEWSKVFPTKDLADKDQLKVRNAINEKVYTRDRGVTVGKFLATWVARKEAEGLKASTIAGYRDIITLHLTPALGEHHLGDLRPDHVQAMLDRIAVTPSLLSGRRDPQPVGAGTLVNVRAVLRAALNDALRRQLVSRNVAQLVTLPKVKRPKPVSVADDRLQTFMLGCQGDPLEPLFHLALIYGERRAELAGLQWVDIDEGARLIQIRHTLLEVKGEHPCSYCGGTHKRLLFDTVKSEAGERQYPLVAEVTASLMAHKLRQNAERDLFGESYLDHGLVFAQPDGNPWRPAWISAQFKRIMISSGAADGLAKVPPIKAMRSTAVTALHERGVALETIAGVTGHSDSGVTRDHYLSITAERARLEFEALAGRLTIGPSPA